VRSTRVVTALLLASVVLSLAPARVAHASVFEAHINFQPCSASVPAGYVADCGYRFEKQDSLKYGWSRSRVAAMRWRHEVSDQRLDTLVKLHVAAGLPPRWGIAVPYGSYKVTVSVGDPTGHGVSSIAINGIVATSEFHSNARHAFKQATVFLSAHGTDDGQPPLIVLDPQNELQSRWDYVDIVQIS
jgi:hypothetical protein